MDVLGSSPQTQGQRSFLLVRIDYFTKWIETKPLVRIIAQQVQSFICKNVICRFEIPHTIIAYNGKQITDKKLTKFCNSLGIKYVISSVEYPQLNG